MVEQARRLDFALSPDALDPHRVNVFERWSFDEELQRFRGDGPGRIRRGGSTKPMYADT